MIATTDTLKHNMIGLFNEDRARKILNAPWFKEFKAWVKQAEDDDVERLASAMMRVARYRCSKSLGVKCYESDKLYKLFEEDRSRDCPTFLDHTWKWIYEEEETLVSEPYTIGMETLEELTRLCKAKGYNFWISSYYGQHFPGHTTPIMFSNRGKT